MKPSTSRAVLHVSLRCHQRNASNCSNEFPKWNPRMIHQRYYAHCANSDLPKFEIQHREARPFVKGKRILKTRRYEDKELTPILRDLYQTPSELYSKNEVEAFMEKNEIAITTELEYDFDNESMKSQLDLPDPYMKMNDFVLPESLFQLLGKFHNPTPIQSYCWPMALKGLDVVGVAPTGSGKTLGFVLPGLIHCFEQDIAPGVGPKMLVVCPTRELAQQSQRVAEPFERKMGFKSVAVFGGEPRIMQLMRIRRGVDIMYGTPGRIVDFLKAEEIDLQFCSYVVIDEADRLMDMRFSNQLESIIRQCRPDRQTLMFSATWPDTVRRLARKLTNEESSVMVKVGAKKLSANKNITQVIEMLSVTDRIPRIVEVMRDNRGVKTLIFVSSKTTVDTMVSYLRKNGFPCVGIHGGKEQYERDIVIQSFREGKTLILVASDLAARGIDVEGIEFVINYEMPSQFQEYVHRIGRTGRGDQEGVALTFVSEKDYDKTKDLVELLEDSGQEVPEELRKIAKLNLTRNSKGFGIIDRSGRQRYSYGSFV